MKKCIATFQNKRLEPKGKKDRFWLKLVILEQVQTAKWQKSDEEELLVGLSDVSLLSAIVGNMHLSKSEFLKHVTDAIGPGTDLRPINQVFQKLPSSVKNTFNDCYKFGAFIKKRPQLFYYHFIGDTIVIGKKSLTGDSQSSSPSTSNESTNQNMPMLKQQSLNSSLSNSSDFDFEKMDMKHLGRRGTKQFMEIVISKLKTEGIVRLPIKDLFEIVMFETGASMNFDQFCEFIANRSNVFDLFKIDGAIYVSNKEKNRSVSWRWANP